MDLETTKRRAGGGMTTTVQRETLVQNVLEAAERVRRVVREDGGKGVRDATTNLVIHVEGLYAFDKNEDGWQEVAS